MVQVEIGEWVHRILQNNQRVKLAGVKDLRRCFDIFPNESFAQQAMVVALFGCLLLLVGTCSAWHDSYHGEHFIHPKSLLDPNLPFADLAPEWPDYLDSFKAELRHPRCLNLRLLFSSNFNARPRKLKI